MSYFAIERGGHYLDHIVLKDGISGAVGFENYLNMTYDEMMSQEDLEDFIEANMDAVDAMFPDENDQTIITLIGDDDVFIWSIIMGTVDEEFRYLPINWQVDGKKYRYEPLDK